MRSKASDDPPLVEASITLPATADQIGSVYTTLSKFWTDLARCHSAPPDPVWRAQFDTAVGEIVANIVRYAYANASTSGEMSIAVQAFGDRVEALLRDRGVPYAGSHLEDARLPSGTSDVLDLPEHGWGLALTLAAVDQLSYTRDSDVNSWRFMKRL